MTAAVLAIAVAGCALAGVAVGPVLAAGTRRVPGVSGGTARALLLSVLAGVAFAVVAARLLPDPQRRYALPAFLVLAAAGAALVVIDLDVRRLPDRITLPAYPVLAVLLVAASLAGGGPDAVPGLVRAGVGALGSAAFYALLAVLPGSQLGFGDVKLAGLLGLALGWLSWPALVIGVVLGFVAAAVPLLVLMVAGRAGWRTRIPFGPAMLAGALAAVLVADPLAALYLSA